MINVRFVYLYRDGGNYKKWGEVVFSNSERMSLQDAFGRLGEAFLPDGLFVAHQIRVPEVFLAIGGQLTEDDHCFHEFASVEDTTALPNDRHGRSISAFVRETARESRRGWRAFDPRARLLLERQ